MQIQLSDKEINNAAHATRLQLELEMVQEQAIAMAEENIDNSSAYDMSIDDMNFDIEL